jgi:type I restriction enzyme S subunit
MKTRINKHNSIEQIQPKLRFPEFKGDWKIYSFRDFIIKIESGWSPICLSEPAINGEWGSLKTTSISWDGYFPEENKKIPDSLEPKPNTEVKVDDILITRVGPFDRVGVVAHVNKNWKKLMVSDNMFRLKLSENILPSFAPLILGSISVQNSWKKKIAGLASAQVVINQQTIFSTLIRLPSLPEQTKIATFLSAVDEKLNLLKEKKQALEDYKKGMMQKIFSQEIRFKDDNGKDFPDWEEKTLGEISQVITKGTTPKKFVESGIKFIKTECFEGSNINISKCLFIDNIIHENELKRSILKENDILFAIAGSIGKVNIITKEILPANTNQALAIIRLKKNENHFYIFQILKSDVMLKFITESVSTGAQPNLNLEQMNSFSFLYPSLTEQTKIANFLSAIDEKIALVSEQIEASTEYKKGLLQQLFC